MKRLAGAAVVAGALFAVAATAGASGKAVTAKVTITGAFHSGAIFHAGHVLQYAAVAYDTSTRKPVLAQSITFALIVGGRSIPLRAKPYQRFYWLGSATVPNGLNGTGRVRATVSAGAQRFSVMSIPFAVRGRVKAVEVARASSQGDYASAAATGGITRPADGYVLASVETSPSQSVDMTWAVVCTRGTAASSSHGSATDGGPGTVTGAMVIEKVPMSLPNADHCTVSFNAQLSESGSLKIDILGNAWP